MHKSRLVTPLVIFVATFALSAVLDVRHLVSRAQGMLSKTTVPKVTAQAAQKPSPPQLWEYRAVEKSSGDKKIDIGKELSQLGEQGFEVFSVTQSSAGACCGGYLTVLLRRPKQ